MTTTRTRPAARTDWRAAYAQRLIFTDVAVIAVAAVASLVLWDLVSPRRSGNGTSITPVDVFSVVLVIVAWAALLALFATREQRYLGAGSDEYRSVVEASFRLFAFVLLVVFLFDVPASRGAVITTFVVGTLGLVLGRWIWRQWLNARRREGRMTSQMVIAGSASSVAHLARELQRRPEAGYSVVAVCVAETPDAPGLDALGIPVIEGLDAIKETMEAYGADTLAIASSGRLPPQRVRELSWQLEPGRQHLVVAPSLTDVGGPRIRMRPVAGLPLLHVETPQFDRPAKALKRTFDVVASFVLLVLLSPLFLVTAVLIASSSRGPILFRQTRVGLNGSTFVMLKFRTMVVDAESRLAQLSELDRTAGNAVMFKMVDDPRITRIGRFLRRYSLDELPQLSNVLRGDMSLIGPRPPLETEVAKYESHVHRRFLMKPGITGLWQVSGRSTLSWEDSVRLDLYYVENWSMTGDFVILWRTIKAVRGRQGAY